MPNRIEDKNLEQYYEENEHLDDDDFDEYEDLEEEYGGEPTYQHMYKQKGLRKMKW